MFMLYVPRALVGLMSGKACNTIEITMSKHRCVCVWCVSLSIQRCNDMPCGAQQATFQHRVSVTKASSNAGAMPSGTAKGIGDSVVAYRRHSTEQQPNLGQDKCCKYASCISSQVQGACGN